MRRATPDDLKELYLMAEAYHKEYSARMKRAPFGFEWVKMASQLYHWLRAEASINYIAEHGAIMGEVRETFFSHDKVGYVHWCYVRPEYRNGLVFRGLVGALTDEAKERGAKYVYWDDWAGMTDSKMLSKFLGHFGFKIQGNVNTLILEGNHNANDNPVYSPYCRSSGAPIE